MFGNTLEDLRRDVSDFRDHRNWRAYHTPKNLAISIAIETAELLENFQWKSDELIHKELKVNTRRRQVSDEIADIIIYCLSLCDVLEVDLGEIVSRKIRKNAKRYPVSALRKPFKKSENGRGTTPLSSNAVK